MASLRDAGRNPVISERAAKHNSVIVRAMFLLAVLADGVVPERGGTVSEFLPVVAEMRFDKRTIRRKMLIRVRERNEGRFIVTSQLRS